MGRHQRLKFYCGCLDGTWQELVAATSKKEAARLLNATVYQINNYMGVNTEPIEPAASNPGVVYYRRASVWPREEWSTVKGA